MPGTDASHLRLFVAIDLASEVKALLRALQEQLRVRTLPVRWIDPAGAHLTLKFLGATAPETLRALEPELERAVRGLRPFGLRTAGLGAFPSLRRPRVLWLGLDGELDALHAAQAAVEQALVPLGFPAEQRPFHPHLTLGRVRPDADAAQLAAIGQALATARLRRAVAFEVREIVLMRSELSRAGARYTPLLRLALDRVS
ncbi:RNA 2',3'-cyclic phosphodiesterase [Kallotenue papyrolyticum]|uniref:RNA 2',3'-cyclic phosphodiesterase n=1 Tax=Kallotenue papyrolyticum TaxID=1325125 RepID=UPI0004785F27|nr:RNA 2',3'-cyclic phosphodiesterase [Kallotenue papyrolyticum]